MGLPARQTQNQISVLLIDGNAGESRLTQKLLDRPTDVVFQTRATNLLSKALAEIKKSPPDLVLMDFDLPDSRGTQTFTQIKKVSSQSNIPIVVLTGSKNQKRALEAAKKGAQDYLIKGQVNERTLSRVLFYAVERNRSAQELQQIAKDAVADREKALLAGKTQKQFFSSISHEIRTPLTAIIGMSDALRATPLNNEQIRFVEILGRSSRILLNLINDILDMSKMETGKFELTERPTAIVQILQECTDLLQVLAEKKKLKLFFQADQKIPTAILADADRIRQVVLNLLGNAIKFTEKGSITVEVKATSANELQICISDTGIGIPAESLHKIFERYEQVKGGKHRLIQGTGLGLSISKKLVELWKGKIWVESKLGQGSQFYFTHPVRQTSAEATRVTKEITATSTKPLQLLLVDDTPDNLVVFEAYLKGQPFQIEYAENGLVGLERFKTKTFDVVFLDMNMPVMTGFEAVKHMRSWEANSKKETTPIITMTADKTPEEINLTFQSGCNAHIAKPLDKNGLFELLQKVAEHNLLEQEPKRIEQTVDEEYQQFQAQLKVSYLEARKQEAELIENAAQKKQFTELHAIFHKVHGTAQPFGLADLGDLAAEIEEAIESRSFQSLPELIKNYLIKLKRL